MWTNIVTGGFVVAGGDGVAVAVAVVVVVSAFTTKDEVISPILIS